MKRILLLLGTFGLMAFGTASAMGEEPDTSTQHGKCVWVCDTTDVSYPTAGACNTACAGPCYGECW